VIIWVVAAQHQLFVSWGRRFTETEPRAGFGVQQLGSEKSAIPAKNNDK
jgi:hypothetical protein